MSETTEECTKIKYGSQEVANRAATLMEWKYGGRKRSYLCPLCADGSWHLATRKNGKRPPRWIRERDKRRKAAEATGEPEGSGSN